MFAIWVVGVISIALLVAVVRLQRWDPLDFLKEAADAGQYGAHRSATFR
jgi:hypothetical protein